jgi:DNA-binding NarL/FixJ family response regulator
MMEFEHLMEITERPEIVFVEGRGSWLTDHVGAWDLAVIDLVLDQGSGMGVVPTARAMAGAEGGTVVVFSDYASDGIRNHCLRLGADAVFLKSQVQEFMDYCSELGGLAAAPAA